MIFVSALLSGFFLPLLMADTPPCPTLTGRVIYPHSETYDKDRLVSNYYTSKDKYPFAIVYCQKTEDVQNAVKWAVCKDIPIRVRSGGHNHEGFSTGTRALVIDVSEMKQFDLDPIAKTATLGPGNTNKEMYDKLFEKGLTHAGGTCSEVGISGLVLSGGMGPLARREGLTADSLISFEMVDAEGKVIKATADNEYKDLFWATRGGGGGNFGILTSITLRVFPVTDVTWFNIGWDWSQPIDKIITAWQAFFAKQDKQWFSHLDIWSKAFPVDKFKKQPVKIMGMFWGTPEEAKKELQPLLSIAPPKSEVFEKVSWAKSIKEIEDSTAVFISDKPEYKSTGAFVMDPLPKEAIDLLYKSLNESNYPLYNVLLFTLGGKTMEVPSNKSAFYYRKALFLAQYSIQWLNEKEDKSHIAFIDEVREMLEPYTKGDYVGNPDPNVDNYMLTYYGPNAERLMEIKAKYDPKNFFMHPQSIPLPDDK